MRSNFLKWSAVFALSVAVSVSGCRHKHPTAPPYNGPVDADPTPHAVYTPADTQTSPSTAPTVTAENGNIPHLGTTLPSHVVIPPVTVPGVTK